VCALCGDLTKPACDQDPECGFHCYGGEHDDAHPYWESDAMCYLVLFDTDFPGSDADRSLAAAAEAKLGALPAGAQLELTDKPAPSTAPAWSMP